MRSSKEIYINPKQQAFLLSEAETKVFLGGRGSGKSYVMGLQFYQYMWSMPRSKGFLYGPTIGQIEENILPEIFAAWGAMGLREHEKGVPGHYVVGTAPPAHWPRAYKQPKKYNNTITLCNGSCFVMVSSERKNSIRGGSYDWGGIDEALLLDKTAIDTAVRPALRGNVQHFRDNPLHYQLCIMSSQAWTQKGEWVSNMKNEVDPTNPRKLFYIESTAMDNIAVLGQGFIDRLRAALPFWVFQVEVMNEKLSRIPNGFYDEFKEAVHIHTDYNDYDKDSILDLSFDFGGKISSCTVSQERKVNGILYEYFINNFYAKRGMEISEPKTLITQVLDKIIHAYKGHQPIVRVFGDRNGNSRTAQSTETLYEQIRRVLVEAGFKVELTVKGLDAFHNLKHFAINKILAEQDLNLPCIRINQLTCKELIISINRAPILADFSKDKSSEKNEDIPQEEATHLSDCFDAIIYQKYSNSFQNREIQYESPMIVGR